MKRGLTAEDIYPAIEGLINQLRNPIEKAKVETMILGMVESFQKRKDRISFELDKIEKYQIKVTKNGNGFNRKRVKNGQRGNGL